MTGNKSHRKDDSSKLVSTEKHRHVSLPPKDKTKRPLPRSPTPPIPPRLFREDDALPQTRVSNENKVVSPKLQRMFENINKRLRLSPQNLGSVSKASSEVKSFNHLPTSLDRCDGSNDSNKKHTGRNSNTSPDTNERGDQLISVVDGTFKHCDVMNRRDGEDPEDPIIDVDMTGSEAPQKTHPQLVVPSSPYKGSARIKHPREPKDREGQTSNPAHDQTVNGRKRRSSSVSNSAVGVAQDNSGSKASAPVQTGKESLPTEEIEAETLIPTSIQEIFNKMQSEVDKGMYFSGILSAISGQAFPGPSHLF